MAIYTKTGDKGETGLVSLDPNNPKRISKNSLRISAIGAVDELNSYLGVCLVEFTDQKEINFFNEIQKNLFSIGAILAGADVNFDKSQTKLLEKEIDIGERSMPVLKNFILPGGGKTGAQLHFARTLVRRAERALVRLHKKESLAPQLLEYINRLSDFLFIKAREFNFKEGKKEIPWNK